MTKILGSLRSVNCSEVEVVLANGTHLVFQLDPRHEPSVRNLVEIRRFRRWAKPREAILLDAHLLQMVRRAVVYSIAAHRAKMHLPAPLQRIVRHTQLQLL